MSDPVGKRDEEAGVAPLPDAPPPPPIPDVLRRPVERPASMQQRRPSAVMAGASGYASAITFIVTVLLFAAAGWGVDRLASTAPWGVVAGLALGMIGATYKLVRESTR